MLLKQNKSHIVDGRNDDDCNFLNCKFKGSNLTFISSWRVLSAPTGPYQALNPKWTITKEEIYRGRNFHSFTHYLTRLLLPPFGTKPLHAEQNYYSSRVLFWKMDDRLKANPTHKIPSFDPWNGASSFLLLFVAAWWSARWWTTQRLAAFVVDPPQLFAFTLASAITWETMYATSHGNCPLRAEEGRGGHIPCC